MSNVESVTTLLPSTRPSSIEARDEGMFLVATTLNQLFNPSGKVILWAHNWHLAKSSRECPVEGRKMGEFLNNKLGEAYFPIGLIAYDAQVHWVKSASSTHLRTPERSLEASLKQIGPEQMLLDLQDPTVKDRFLANRQPYAIAAGSPPVRDHDLSDYFSALIFLKYSRAISVHF